MDRAHAAGLAVNVWTVNSADDLAAFVGLGVDGLITDHLAEALSIVGAARAGGARPIAPGAARIAPVGGRNAEWRQGTQFVKDERP